MAILNRLACIPSEEECSILSGIQGRFEVWQQKLLFPKDIAQEIYLVGANSHDTVCIRSDYEDVQFKFECLYLTVCRKPADKSVFSGLKIGPAKNWQQAKAVLRTEWERPALPGEVPPHYEQVVQVRGELNDVPAGVPACISMVGVLLVGADGANQGLVYLDDDFPLSLGYAEDPEEIRQFLSQSSTHVIDEVAAIKGQLRDWRKVAEPL